MLDFSQNRPLVFLAPMAGYSDAPMREMVSHFGVDAVVSEMMACQEWKTGRAGVSERVARGELAHDTHYIVQIAGRDPELLAEAAQFAQDQGAEQIDINMGCPAKKVVSGATAGAALLLEPNLAMKIVESVANAVSVPVSVKTRLGWDQHSTKGLVHDFENAGARMLTIHGRTRQQKYRGCADWNAVREIVDRAHVPVVVNGDIVDQISAQRALEQSKAQGVMIGRGAIGAPKLPAQIISYLGGKNQVTKENILSISMHYKKILTYYGEEHGLLSARKHLKAYFAKSPKVNIQNLLRESNPSRVLDQILAYEALGHV